MEVYIAATILSAFLGFVAQYSKQTEAADKHINNLIKVLAGLPLFLVAALRYNVGTDYPFTYRQRFLVRLNGYDLSDIFEAGFIKLIDLIQLFTQDPQWLFVVCAFLFSFFVCKAIYQQSCSYALSFSVLVLGGHYFANLNLMRNYVALAICLYALKYIKSREVWKYVIWILIASTLHTSVLLYLPLYFIYNLKITRWFVVGVIAAAGIGLPVIDVLARYVVTFTDYAWYYNARNSNVVPQISYLIINLLILGIQLYAYREMKEDKEFQFYFKIQMIIVVIATSSFVVPLIRRLILIPIFTQIITIPYIKRFKINRYIKAGILVLLLVVMTFVTIRQITVQEMHEVLPYQTIFSLY